MDRAKSTTLSSSSSPSALEGIFPFLNLPYDIRFKIYTLLYHWPSKIMPATVSSTRKYKFPISLLLTCHQIYTEAAHVLYSTNTISLVLPLTWKDSRPNAYRIAGYSGIPKETTFIPFPRNLCQIRDLVIEISLFRHIGIGTPAGIPSYPFTQVRKTLEGICAVLREGHELQVLDVCFSNRPPNIGLDDRVFTNGCIGYAEHYSERELRVMRLRQEGSPRVLDHECICSETPSSAFGKRHLGVTELEQLCRMAQGVDQQVLEPLRDIRGVDTVYIVGNVEQDYGEYLKRTIMSPLDSKVEAFRHKNPVKWGDQRLVTKKDKKKKQNSNRS